MKTLKLKNPVGSGKFNTIFPKLTDLNYFIDEYGIINVKHNVINNAVIPVKHSNVIFNKE